MGTGGPWVAIGGEWGVRLMVGLVVGPVIAVGLVVGFVIAVVNSCFGFVAICDWACGWLMVDLGLVAMGSRWLRLVLDFS
jgi:hypothetical protein